jgi:hypothetical protein
MVEVEARVTRTEQLLDLTVEEQAKGKNQFESQNNFVD